MTAPRIPDEVAFAALGAFEAARVQRGLSRLEALRAALEVALTHLAPRPVVDREAVMKMLANEGVGSYKLTTDQQLIEHRTQVAAAVLALINEQEKR